MILKTPGSPPDGGSPYDAALEGMPRLARERHEVVRARSDALKVAAGDGYHVSWLGTVPECRRRGMGGALVRMALERARADGATLRLSTNSAENVGLSRTS
jgi:ribosomal protein S18 acetylase RimI-like enzyme